MASRRYIVELSEAALSDLEGIVSFVANQSPRAAERLHNRLLSAALTLERHPNRGRVVPELDRLAIVDVRELLVGPYRVLYRVEGRRVFVLTAFDGRRDLDWVLLRMMLHDSRAR
ncbi:MAG TPA: type II toxin-antitoxin system RelE/ParE family toxin [Myxococcaceae bacterium]|nr:type II toxin-antitoxin system RelE/ParE family toxin [Myxococcaceae bacterium]